MAGGDRNGTGLVNHTKLNGPLFRVFGTYANVTPAGTVQIHSPGENLANGNPSRTFPDMDQILANNTNADTGTCPAAPAGLPVARQRPDPDGRVLRGVAADGRLRRRRRSPATPSRRSTSGSPRATVDPVAVATRSTTSS